MASNAAARRKYLLEKAAASTVQSAPICQLPASIVLHIFMFLDTKTMCSLSKVCRQWYHLASDRSLWKIVDLQEWPLTLRTLWKFVRNRLTESVTELRIRGSMTKKNQNISPSLLMAIKTKCPGLKVLSLYYCDMRNIDMRCVPAAGLRSLCLEKSVIPLGWFDSLLTTEMYLPNLVNLNLTHCTRLSDADLASIARITSLEQLNLYFCYRVGDPGIREVATSLQALVQLDISHCFRITDVSLHYIGRHLTRLETLGLESCSRITDAGISSLVHSMLNLKHLNLRSCNKITDNALNSIAQNCKKLKELRITNCREVTKDGITIVETTLPQCEIL